MAQKSSTHPWSAAYARRRQARATGAGAADTDDEFGTNEAVLEAHPASTGRAAEQTVSDCSGCSAAKRAEH